MWKSFSRGVFGNANILKVDQSIISGLVNKDIDELTSQSSTRNKCSHCSDENAKSNAHIRRRKTHYEQQPLSERVNKSGKGSDAQLCRKVSLALHGTSAPDGSVSLSDAVKPRNSLTKFENGYSNKHHRNVIFGSVRLHSCEVLDESTRDDVNPFLPSWLSQNRDLKIRIENGPPVFISRNTLLKYSNLKPGCNLVLRRKESKDVSFSVRNLESIPASSYSHLTFFNRNTADNVVQNSNPSKNEVSFYDKFQSSEESSYCLLKLPFSNSNLVNLKGLNRLTTCWLKNSTEFGGNGNRSNGKSRTGESEEAKEEPLRRYHIHQSLLEAIGWSSAILLGWFLAQFRIRHLCERRNAKHKKNGERRQCVVGILNRLVSSLRDDNFSSQKSYSIERSNVASEKKRKKYSNVHASEDKGTFTSGEEDSEGYLSERVLQVNDLKKHSHLRNQNHSLLYESSHASSETPNNAENILNTQSSSTADGKERTVIPLPWYENSKQLLYGPMTFEEAVNEASKGLEEAQAEVLLQLALEKLDANENLVSPEPSAVELLESSARLGNAAAAFNLGICYEIGVGGVGKDLSSAYYWYKKASDVGHAAATYNIAIFHAQGLAGLQPDERLAYQLLEKASSLGQTEATDALALLTSLKLTKREDKEKSCMQQETGDVLDQEDIGCNNDFVNESQVVPVRFYSSPSMELSSLGFSKDATFKLDNLMDSFSLTLCNLDEFEESIMNGLLELAQNVKRT